MASGYEGFGAGRRSTTNMFDRPRLNLNQSVNEGLGFNLQNMLRSGMAEGMQDVEERRQMGRKKFASDILSQQLEQASRDLANQKFGYEFGQQKQTWGMPGGEGTPETQAMMRAYALRQGSPWQGGAHTPEQYRMGQEMEGGRLKAEGEAKQAASMIIMYSNPGSPEYEWAARTLGIAPSTNVPAGGVVPAVKPVSTSPTAKPKTAFGTFLHEAAGPVAGGASFAGGARAGSRFGLPGSIIGGGLAALVGNAITDQAMGELTPEEQAAHPTAAKAGGLAGNIAGLLLGARGMKGKGTTATIAGGTLPGQVVQQTKNLGGVFKRMFGKGRSPTSPPTPQSTAPIPMGGQTPSGLDPIPMPQPVVAPTLPPRPSIPMPSQPIPMAQPVPNPPPFAPDPAIQKALEQFRHQQGIPMAQPAPIPTVPPPVNIPGPGGPIPMAQPVRNPLMPPASTIAANPELEALLRSQMQGPQLPSAAPGLSDPQLRAYLERYFRRNPSPIAP